MANNKTTQQYYLLINYFIQNYNGILDSVIARGGNIEETNIRFASLFEKIGSTKPLNQLIANYMGKRKTSALSSEEENDLNQAKAQLKELLNFIYNEIISMPNLLDSTCPTVDETLTEHKGCVVDVKQRMTYTDYLSKYCITSIGRVVFKTYPLANIESLLISFLHKHNKEHDFEYISTNDIIHEDFLVSAGQLPKFANNLYKIDDKIYLVPTGEVSLLEYVIKSNLTENKLLFTYGSCYRNETSNVSKINKPLIRQAIFHKCETFVFCKSEDEDSMLSMLLNNATSILKKLKFTYRVDRISAAESSASAYKQYDVLVYLPKSDIYVEILSCSSCHSYQLIRSFAYTTNYDKYVTLNCSALPIERTLAALIEYYWDISNNKFSEELLNILLS